jgi:GNAT superfamily N-acetyltransferase
MENVVTHADYRGEGYAAECLNYAREIAQKANCYKMMLLTGSDVDATEKHLSRQKRKWKKRQKSIDEKKDVFLPT